MFALLLGTITEIYCIWAFPVLFYTHWEIIFVAISLFALILAGLVFLIGVTRLGVSYNKEDIKRIAGKRALLLCAVSVVFPLSFIARVIDFSKLDYLLPFVMPFLVIALIAVFKYAYDKIK